MTDSPRPPDRSERWRRYVTIALVSLATLVFQVAITRVLSVVLWYHFAFLSISLAMLGLGAPGAWFALRPPTHRSLGRALIAAAVALPLSVIGIFGLGDQLHRGDGIISGVAAMFPSGVLFIVLLILLATLSLGAAVCILLIEARGPEVGRVYGADLIGATIGAALVVPLMHVVPTPIIVGASGLLPLLGAAISGRIRLRVTVPLAALLLALMVWGKPFELTYSKQYAEQKYELLYEKWTPTARLTVFKDVIFQKDGALGFGWGMGERYKPKPIEQLWLEQDGSAGTPITRLAGSPADLGHLRFDVTSVGYDLKAPKNVCVIGVGGGRDVLTALGAGAEKVDAVELNPHIVDALSGPFAEFSGDIYHRPGVTPVVSEGRSFLTGTDHRYDLLQISLIDSWAATAAGAFALSENYLYTMEAFQLYLDRLAPGGVLSVSRWAYGQRVLEAARLVVLAKEALISRGVAEPLEHMFAVQAGTVLTLLVSNEPFTDADTAALDAICAQRGFARHWPPGPSTPEKSAMTIALLGGGDALASLGVDLSPPTDERPFFFQSVAPFTSVSSDLMTSLSPNEHSVVLLRWLLLIVSLLTLAVFVAPFVLTRQLNTGAGFWRGSAYFAAIGIAFMFVEIGWIQRFILYLGHPSHATTTVLATLLLGAGIGSTLSARTSLALVRKLAPLLAVVIFIANQAMTPLFDATIGASFAVRVLLSVVVLFPAGFLMGFAFPTGMIYFGDRSKAWFWAINGAMGVFASISSLALAMVVGFNTVVFVGVGAYLVAALCIQAVPRETAAE
jgi:hypothetical protein